MRKVIAGLLFAFLGLPAMAEEPLVWSHYTAPLKLERVDPDNNLASFTGEFTVSGNLVFVFEGDHQEADLMWVVLVPDPGERGRLPQVVAGKFAAPLRDLWILPPEEVLLRLPGIMEAARAEDGLRRYVTRHATLRLKDYTTLAECGLHRGYHATLVSVSKFSGPLIVGSPSGPHDAC